MATRIDADSRITSSVADVEFTRAGRFRRYGRLPVPPGANGREVRCACNHCGAHLYATPGAQGSLDGICIVCGGDDVSPVT